MAHKKQVPVTKWITQGLKISLKNGSNQYKAVQAGRNPKEEYIKYKKILGNVLRVPKQLYYKMATKTSTTDSRKQWSIINKVIDRTKCRHKIPTTFTHSGSTINTPTKEVSNVFNDYFACIGKDMANSLPTEKDYEKHLHETSIKDGFTLHTLIRKDIESIIKNQKPKLSCGIDGINNRIVKECHKEFALPMTIIINKSIE